MSEVKAALDVLVRFVQHLEQRDEADRRTSEPRRSALSVPPANGNPFEHIQHDILQLLHIRHMNAKEFAFLRDIKQEDPRLWQELQGALGQLKLAGRIYRHGAKYRRRPLKTGSDSLMTASKITGGTSI